MPGDADIDDVLGLPPPFVVFLGADLEDDDEWLQRECWTPAEVVGEVLAWLRDPGLDWWLRTTGVHSPSIGIIGKRLGADDAWAGIGCRRRCEELADFIRAQRWPKRGPYWNEPL